MELLLVFPFAENQVVTDQPFVELAKSIRETDCVLVVFGSESPFSILAVDVLC